MNLKVGDKILVTTNPSKWNGGSGEAVQMGQVVNLDSEKVRLRVSDRGDIEVPLKYIARIEILEAKEPILQKALGMGIMVISFIMEAIVTAIGLVALGVFITGLWIKGRFKRRKEKW